MRTRPSRSNLFPSASLVGRLRCPRDRATLGLDGSWLICEQGHRYPVVDGVPVLLVEEDQPTIGLARDSIACARRAAAGEYNGDPWFSETLGLSADQRAALAAESPKRSLKVDPVVSLLVAATNGMHYRDRVGQLREYPIPEIRLPPGNGETLIDVGCSWGRWSLAAARQGYRVCGIDPSLGAVLAAQRLAGRLDLTVEFVVGDARRLPFREESFDRAFSYSVLQHFSERDLRVGLTEIGRVLEAGGSSLIQMPNRFGARCIFHQLRRGFREATGFEVRYHSPGELLAAFERAIGGTTFSADCFFGIGLQRSDLEHVSAPARRVIRASEAMRATSERLPCLRWLADSLYFYSKAGPRSVNAR